MKPEMTSMQSLSSGDFSEKEVETVVELMKKKIK